MDSPKRAKKVRFFRNGDKFFNGFQFAISSDRYKTFDALMQDLTLSPVCDKNILPKGVRFLFCMNGQKVRSLEEFADGGSYVAASFDQFKKVDYAASSVKTWSCVSKKSSNGVLPMPPTFKSKKLADSGRIDIGKDEIKPHLIVVLAGGARPRKGTRILLNSKTAKSYDNIVMEISQSIKLTTGAVKKLYDLNGKLVIGLNDMIGEESVFVAYGTERMHPADLILDENDHKYINSSGTSSSRVQSARPVSHSRPQRPVNTALATVNSVPNSPDPRRRQQVLPKPKQTATLSEIRRKSIDSPEMQVPPINGGVVNGNGLYGSNGHVSPANNGLLDSPNGEISHNNLLEDDKRDVIDDEPVAAEPLVDPAAD